MRANMDPLNPMASMLDPKIAQIYSQASAIREEVRSVVPKMDEAAAQRRRTKELAVEVLGMPDKLRTLVDEGKTEDAKKEWELPRRLLLLWQENGLGGDDVAACLEEGDSIFRIEDSESSSQTSKDSG